MHITSLRAHRLAAADAYDRLLAEQKERPTPEGAEQLVGLDEVIDCLSGEIFRRETGR